MLQFLLIIGLNIVHAKTFHNDSLLQIPGMEMMSSDKYPHFTVIESNNIKWNEALNVILLALLNSLIGVN
ncbi:hypothetical protein DICVIV_07452 [Dictyocaulus viviparus]|uniref:Uncharacterized protein n=1 Tax=Dictyocaulus viviparus TaxID=29172 RepID=A0A0D8XPD5_DICVI|nr:hypothetical protein DICVIV_07452 [Dictyocaulus viviparus]